MPPAGLALMGVWFAFGLAFLARPRTAAAVERRRDPRAAAGLALQGLGYFLVWLHAPDSGTTMPAAVQWLGVAIGAASALLAFTAVRHLGKQWAIRARLVEGHQLVTSGPYAWVRHPIYTGMLGMLVATGLVLATLTRLAVGLGLFLAGTRVRTSAEEALLRQEFGEAFEAYRQRTGWLLPGL